MEDFVFSLPHEKYTKCTVNRGDLEPEVTYLDNSSIPEILSLYKEFLYEMLFHCEVQLLVFIT